MSRSRFRHASPAVLLVLALLAPAACRGPRTEAVASYAGAPLPRPDRILVEDFAVAPQDIRLDQGVSARLLRTSSGQPDSAGQLAVARDVQRVVTATVVEALRDRGLPAEPAGSAPSTAGNSVLVQGQIVSIDQGNKTRRTLLGFGAGQSEVTADGQVFYRRGAAAPVLLVSVQGNANSGRAPGAAGTLGVGAAAGHVATSAAAGAGMHLYSEQDRASSEAEGRSLGEAIAQRLLDYFARMGWVAPG